jgi:hypothetical protein
VRIPAQTSSGSAALIANAVPFFGIGTIAGIFGMRNRSRIFVVTDQRILVLDAGWVPAGGPLDWVAVSRAVGVVAELPGRLAWARPPAGST